MKLAIKIWKTTVDTLKKHPKLFIPLAIAAGLSGVLLYVLYLAPVRPISIVLGPPIRAFFGEGFLHYPHSIFLLPKLFYYAQLVLGATVGVLMIGTTVGLVNNVRKEEDPKFSANLGRAFKKYFVLFGIWAVMFVLTFLFAKLVRRSFSESPHQLAIALATYIVSMFIQIIFIYAMPIAIIKKKGFLGALKEGVLFFKKFFLTSIVLIIIPSLLYCPIVMFNHHLAKLIKTFSPEIVIVYLSLGILVTFIIEILITCSATMLLLDKGSSESGKT